MLKFYTIKMKSHYCVLNQLLDLPIMLKIIKHFKQYQDVNYQIHYKLLLKIIKSF